MMWQPIETAPKDGKKYLCWSKDFGFMVVNQPKGYAAGDWQKIRRRWRGSFFLGADAATHWMPLPQPPEAE